MDDQRSVAAGAGAPESAATGGSVTVVSAAVVDRRVQPVRVDVQVPLGEQPGFEVVGESLSALRELRDRLRAAMLTSGLRWPDKAIRVTLTPRVRSSRARAALDLPVAMALLAADGQVPADQVNGKAFLGQLGLDGTIRDAGDPHALVGAIPTAEVIVPVESLREAHAAARDKGDIRVQAHYNLNTLLAVLDPRSRTLAPATRGRRGSVERPDIGDAVGDRYVSVVSGDVVEALGDGRYAVVDGPHGVPSQLPLGTVVAAGRPLDTWRSVGPISGWNETHDQANQESAAGRPYVRSASSDPVPQGWVAERTLLPWEGHEADVVYDPRRYQVAMNWDPGDDKVEQALQATGWERHAVDGHRTLWIRDRLEATRAALGRFDRPAADGLGAVQDAHPVDPGTISAPGLTR